MDSNHRPIIYETIALSLSYGGICAVGVVRTHDSILKRDVLYQLSYDSIKTWRRLFTVSIHNMRWFSKISSAELKKHRIFSWIHACIYQIHSLTQYKGMTKTVWNMGWKKDLTNGWRPMTLNINLPSTSFGAFVATCSRETPCKECCISTLIEQSKSGMSISTPSRGVFWA